jgi:hypothetical protein
MATKITKVQMFTMIAALAEVQANPDMVAFINHEIELLNNKSVNKKPTERQIENEKFKELIFEYFCHCEGHKTIKEIQAAIPELANLSNQRMTHLLSNMVINGKLEKEYEKKTPYYSIAC